MLLNSFSYKSLFVLALAYLALLGVIFLNTAIASNEFLSTDKEGSESAGELFTNPTEDSDTPKGWSGDIEVGFILSTGNVDNTNATISVTAIHNKQPLKQTFTVGLFFAKNQGEKTAEQISIDYKLDYAINSQRYIFSLSAYHKDQFTNIDNRFAEIIGYGHFLIKNKTHKLNSELGLGIRQTKYLDNTKKSKELTGYLALHYKRKLTENTTLSEDFSTLSGNDNTFTELVSALEVNMTKMLSLSVKYTLNHNQTVQTGFENLDTIMSINLVGDF